MRQTYRKYSKMKRRICGSESLEKRSLRIKTRNTKFRRLKRIPIAAGLSI